MFLTVGPSPLHGQGCFATRDLAPGTVAARSPILVFPPEQMGELFRTRLKDYLFYLKDGDLSDGPFFTALAIGPISFCNHSREPNCDFIIEEAVSEIVLTARIPICQNEEITIDYGDYASEII